MFGSFWKLRWCCRHPRRLRFLPTHPSISLATFFFQSWLLKRDLEFLVCKGVLQEEERRSLAAYQKFALKVPDADEDGV